jgi:hypothetical protein
MVKGHVFCASLEETKKRKGKGCEFITTWDIYAREREMQR